MRICDHDDVSSDLDLDLDYQLEEPKPGLDSEMEMDVLGNDSELDANSEIERNSDSLTSCATNPTLTLTHTTHSMSQTLSTPLEDPILAISLDKLQKLSKEDFIGHNLNMQGQVLTMEHELQKANRMWRSSESHCTLAVHMIEDVNTHLDNTNIKRNRGTVKAKAWVVVAPDLKELFEQEECDAEAWERGAKEKEKVKAIVTTDCDC